MCGIAGFWSFGGGSCDFLEKTVSNMAKTLDHRGPDGQGIWVDAQHGIALGHRRLSIVDLSNLGHQPMVSGCGRYVIVLNGEIYNTKELQQDFSLNIPADKGHSDTRIILEAISHFGVETVIHKANGMFAFGLWDKKLCQLSLVRDRLGVKPLYWSLHNKTLIFGSELKSFFPHPHWSSSINRQAIASVLHYNYVNDDTCIYEHVQKIKPGTIVVVDEDTSKRVITYWSSKKMLDVPKIDASSHQFFEQRRSHLHELLKDAVGLRMMADVPVGAFLSGGIDSSLVVSMMQQQSATPVKTFSVGFEENDFNEAIFARQIANHLKTDHYEASLGQRQAFDLVEKMPYYFDEPFADSSQLPTYFVSALAKKCVSVVLSGDGGDELFAGYNRYIYAKKLWKMLHGLPKILRSTIKYLVPHLPSSLISVGGKVSKIPQLHQKIERTMRLFNASSFVDFYQQILEANGVYQDVIQESYAIHDATIDGWHPQKYIQGDGDISLMQLIDINHYLVGDILTKVDRSTMAHGLEGREPLLDYRLVEFAFSLPAEDKIQKNKGKYILRHILSSYVPKHFFERPKMGFGVPLATWLRGRFFKPWARDLIYGKEVEALGLNKEPIQRLWEEHCSEKHNHQYALWGILMVLSWYRHWHRISP